VPPIGLWTGIETSRGELEAPLIEGALGWIECSLASEVEAGDHTFFLGEVTSVRRGPGREALVHVGGGYT
jgi:flavin reductase (DIM6/NTAB) family NADH-FMN oxidoreductase RutF